MVGQERVKTELGVAQGSVLSPELFNFYLHETRTSREHLRQLIKEGNLQAFADDLLCDLWAVERTKHTVRKF